MSTTLSMNSVVLQFVRKCKVENSASSSPWSHTSLMAPTTGKYLIHNEKLEAFRELYNTQVFALKDKFICGLAEKPNPRNNPLLCDFDIKIPLEETTNLEKHLYTKSQLNRVITLYMNVIKQVVKDVTLDQLVCFVLEKPKPIVKDDQLSSGFHLHWPFFFMSTVDLEVHITARVKEKLTEENLFENIGVSRSGDLIDTSINSKNWLMYGSRKSLTSYAYFLSRIVDSDGHEITLGEALENNKIYDLEDQEVDMSARGEEWFLPQILSIDCNKRPLFAMKPNVECVGKKHLVKAATQNIIYEQTSLADAILLVDKFLPLLSCSRASNHDTWMKVGWCLWKVLGNGSKEGFDQWVSFSRTTTKNNFDEATCFQKWTSMTPETMTLTIGSLKAWAKMDSPEDYEALIKEHQTERIKDSLKISGHADFVKYLHVKYSSLFICAAIKADTWYFFNGTRWKITEGGHHLRKKIDEDIIPHLFSLARTASSEAEDTDKTPKEISAEISQYYKIIGNLKNTTFRNCIMIQAKDSFSDDTFFEKLDMNTSLVGFENGVLDLQAGVFRQGLPSDYLTFSCGYDFKDYTGIEEESQDIFDVLEFWIKIITDEDVRLLFMDYCGKLLEGKNTDQVFLIMSGVGENGKSMGVELIQQTLGEYSGVFPTTILTGKETQSSCASPELAASKGKRLMTLSEPDANDKIHEGVLKRLTGGDAISYRGLYQNQTTFIPQFKLVYICNHLPKLTADEHAVWRRIQRIPFTSRFPSVDTDVPLTSEAQLASKTFKRDHGLIKKMPGMRQAMMWIMFKSYKRVKAYKTPPKIPDIVLKSKQLMQEENDFCLQFIKESMTRDLDAEITLSDFYLAFKAWYSDLYNTTKTPNKNDVRTQMIKKWGNLINNKWIGWRPKLIEEYENVAVVTI